MFATGCRKDSYRFDRACAISHAAEAEPGYEWYIENGLLETEGPTPMFLLPLPHSSLYHEIVSGSVMQVHASPPLSRRLQVDTRLRSQTAMPPRAAAVDWPR